VRGEPAGGITDPAGYDGRLIQDDATFCAAICGIGTLGLVYSLVLEVREKFWLREVRTVSTWERVRDTVTPGGVLGEGDHYELFLNPYGEHRLVVTRRYEIDEPHGEPEDKLERHPLTELESKLPITGVLLRLAARYWPALLAWRFDAVLDGMRDDAYDNVSYKVFNIGEANRLPAVSMELGVTLEGNRHLEAVDRILAIAAERRKRDKLIHTSPIALRFVDASRAYASMMHEQQTMMIELILVTGTRGCDELLAGYERDLADLGARPHWGQINALTAERVRQLYPRWEDWLAVERELNSTGVFDSPFTRRLDI
jgi:D-arabinono-1,4-lactone oxidase